ncbi:HEPN domain-containing protein [Thermosynechococcaceae cyanobacterium BACA0444]|uniref:HEPN domain-containing protein n=1 Tax=Pseudocalidococcus azoricus BACA0444 TaxID=2918990 RepID=A0AAE4JX92_9CYAN|nr:HEPN domain-containing protein [Pseudocalidococcus azoricus]MDS3860908.1 HEPN domain-containing protein [Pseudocalidococcus azoricus BACA0444]
MAIKDEICFRKDTSISRQIQTLVRDTFLKEGLPDQEVDDLEKRTKNIYKLRSKLVHDGKLPDQTLSSALKDAKEIVRAVLKAKFNDLA